MYFSKLWMKMNCSAISVHWFWPCAQFRGSAQRCEKRVRTLLRRLCVQRHTAAALWWR